MTDKKLTKICVISEGYPTPQQPWFSFVDQLLCAMTEHGVECTVIAPQSITKGLLHKNHRRPKVWYREWKGNKIKVVQPKYISLSNFRIKNVSVGDELFERAVIKAFSNLNESFDAVYGHFWYSGLIAAKIGEKYNIPAFLACGESVIPYDRLQKNLEYKDNLSGIICVSTKCLEESVELGLAQRERMVVYPNGINREVFYLMDKSECRKKLNIPQDCFIAAFVGTFNNRKGSLRLSAALDEISDVYSIFIGSGADEPTCKRRIFTGSLPHSEIAQYLCAADVFVLPTLHEGCCNAIIEAMACGLPVISSNLSFNDDILTEENSVRINPNSVEEIKAAIIKVKEDKAACESMHLNALETAENLSIESRAFKIIKYIEENI